MFSVLCCLCAFTSCLFFYSLPFLSLTHSFYLSLTLSLPLSLSLSRSLSVFLLLFFHIPLQSDSYPTQPDWNSVQSDSHIPSVRLSRTHTSCPIWLTSCPQYYRIWTESFELSLAVVIACRNRNKSVLFICVWFWTFAYKTACRTEKLSIAWSSVWVCVRVQVCKCAYVCACV